MIDMNLLKQRVKGAVFFDRFTNYTLYYRTEDNWIFAVPVKDTINEQGNQPIFLAHDKGIVFMRWIRKSMEEQLPTVSNP